MADNEHPPPGAPNQGAPGDPARPADEARTPPTGLPAPLVPPEPPAGELTVRPPAAPIDPEMVQQFQQFQQFQELMRQQQEQGFPQGTPPQPGSLQPWGPPPPRPPLWRRLLRPLVGKLVTVGLVALLLAGVAYWLLDKLPGSGPPESPGPPHVIGGKKAETNLIFETDPRNAVQKIYDDVAQGDPTSACGRFTEQARAEFADHYSRLGGSCEEIVGKLNAQVTPGSKSDYANPRFPPSVNTNPTTDTVPVSSCALDVTGGPRLGLLTVGKIENSVGGQWIVIRHDAEPDNCAGVPTAPPTS